MFSEVSISLCVCVVQIITKSVLAAPILTIDYKTLILLNRSSNLATIRKKTRYPIKFTAKRYNSLANYSERQINTATITILDYNNVAMMSNTIVCMEI